MSISIQIFIVPCLPLQVFASVLNLSHLKMFNAMGLKLSHRGSLQWHHLPTEFRENLPIGYGGTQTDRRTDELIGLLSV
jgi:hypothetical protein